jgi:EmrB/QacA subfamily drug resistance transporter
MHTRNRWAVLAVVCASVYLINLDITIVNAALPTLVRELDAGTRDLQWIVDAYNLTFAAFVLAAGSLSDRYGRRGALVTGLAIFGTATAAGAAAGTTGGLIAARLVMGVGAAVIFPTTLSIISNTFSDRRERAQAIGIWGAITGVGVATGPLAGGWLLEHFWWGSVFLYMAPVAALAMLLTWRFVPESRDPATPPIDRLGLTLSTGAIGTLVYTIIEAPARSWGAPITLAGFALSTALLLAFVAWERRQAAPMIDVRLFRDLRFSAACGAVTVAWFCLFGFIFLITQYFQFLKGYGPLTFGGALMPVAGSIAAGAVAGVLISVRVGNKVVVASGLGLMGVFFLWVSTISAGTPYWPEIVAQMVVIGLGLGLTTAPATEAIMGVVPKDKAGVGSAVNDATRELGGTLGVAVLGSVSASIYTRSLESAGALADVPGAAATAARESVGGALLASAELGRQAPELSARLIQAADTAFFRSLQAACLIAGFIALAGGIFAAAVLPARPSPESGTVARPGEVSAQELPAPAA